MSILVSRKIVSFGSFGPDSNLFKGLTANAADRDTDGDVEAEAKGEAEAEDQQVLIATLDLQGGVLFIFLKHILKCISNDSR